MEISEDFKTALGLLNPKTVKNTQVVSQDEIRNGFMLHIDLVNPKTFIPMMPRSAAVSEENTTPRVTVAPTLLGCIIGYARVFSDFIGNPQEGYLINRIDFEHCLKPNDKLVYDAPETGEHWLIAYNKKTQQYDPKVIGKLFMTQAVIERTPLESRGKKQKNKTNPYSKLIRAVMWCEISEKICFDNERDLTPGYWRFIFNRDFQTEMSLREKNSVVVLEVSAGEYMKAKNYTAGKLSYVEPTPPVGLSHNW